MEQETYIPGLNEGVRNSAYTPDNNNFQDGTMLAGYGQAPGAQKADTSKSNNVNNGKTPVVGFLYSISKNGFPEYWPLYVGTNSIGKSADSQIKLGEASVSEHHANIQIKKMRSNGGRLIATIVDTGSKNGIVVNDEELDYDRHQLNNGDLITIGLNYKLAFILVDPIAYGLEVAENFVETDKQEEAPAQTPPALPGNATHQIPNPPYSNPYANVAPIQDETMNIYSDGNKGLNAGGTKIM